MYRIVFTVGVAVTKVVYNTDGTLISVAFTSANALTDYSYINARDSNPNSAWVARCLTGLGPTSNSIGASGELGGFYFNGSMIPNSVEAAQCSSAVIQVRPGGVTAGVTNFFQCQQFTTDNEGVYTCTMLNSAMINESVRFGMYFNGRSESFNLHMYPIN